MPEEQGGEDVTGAAADGERQARYGRQPAGLGVVGQDCQTLGLARHR